ncbi:hypothetical protein BCR42DRAFT_475476, partial [Absidia repens]
MAQNLQLKDSHTNCLKTSTENSKLSPPKTEKPSTASSQKVLPNTTVTPGQRVAPQINNWWQSSSVATWMPISSSNRCTRMPKKYDLRQEQPPNSSKILAPFSRKTIQQQQCSNSSRCDKKCQALAVYGFSTSKQLDNDAKKLTVNSIKLPASMRYIDEAEEEDKDMAFSAEDMERLHSERFQERLLQQTTNRRGGYGNGNGFGKQAFRGGRQSFGFQQRNQQQQQKSFFGKPRQHQSHQQSNNHSTPANQ